MLRHFDLAVVRRNPWVLALASLPFALCVLAVGLAIAVHPAFLALIVHGAAIGERRIARDDLVGGYLVPGHDDRVTIRPQRRGLAPDIELIAESEAQAGAVLRALGFAAEQSVVAFRTMSLVHAHTWVLMGAVCAVMAVALGLGAVLGRFVGGAATPSLVPLVAILFAVVAVAPAARRSRRRRRARALARPRAIHSPRQYRSRARDRARLRTASDQRPHRPRLTRHPTSRQPLARSPSAVRSRRTLPR